jgi:hypothetical protein
MPNFTVTDQRDNTANQTTYTFSACRIGGGASSMPERIILNSRPSMRSASNRLVVVVVHAENTVATWGVSSITIGGVAGFLWVDRNAQINPINTAIRAWRGSDLDAIANTDIVVTMSTAITGCSIVVIQIDNLYSFNEGVPTAFTTDGAGAAMTVSPSSGTVVVPTRNVAVLGASTNASAVGTEQFEIYNSAGSTAGVSWSNVNPILLYEGGNAEFSYAGFWYWVPGHIPSGSIGAAVVGWSGTAAADLVVAAVY